MKITFIISIHAPIQGAIFPMVKVIQFSLISIHAPIQGAIVRHIQLCILV